MTTQTQPEAGWEFAPGQPLVPGLLAWTRLGDGPRCETWLAWDVARWSPAAVKVPLPATLRAGRGVAALRPELEAAADLAHPGIQRLLDSSLEGPLPYMEFEYVEGPTLEAALEDEGPFHPIDVVLTGMQLTAALGYLHAGGLVHLDVKPGNVVLRDQRPVLIDFGFTSHAGSPPPPGRIRGTPAWMAPEQVQRAPAAPSMDLFALGALLYELATARPAFEPADEGSELERWPQLRRDRDAQRQVLDGAVGPPLARLIGSLLELDPADRPASATEVLGALDGALPPEAAAERFWPTWASSALRARGSAGSTTLFVGKAAGMLDGGDCG
jgi:eukaryotic-like serine/threonine-protein kinase